MTQGFSQFCVFSYNDYGSSKAKKEINSVRIGGGPHGARESPKSATFHTYMEFATA